MKESKRLLFARIRNQDKGILLKEGDGYIYRFTTLDAHFIECEANKHLTKISGEIFHLVGVPVEADPNAPAPTNPQEQTPTKKIVKEVDISWEYENGETKYSVPDVSVIEDTFKRDAVIRGFHKHTDPIMENIKFLKKDMYPDE